MGTQVSKRRKRILDELIRKNYLPVASICEMFDVSGETIRKDLIDMEREGALRRHHGGVSLAASGGDVKPLTARREDCQAAKQRIAEAVLRHIPLEKTVIGLDAGNTVWHVARLLLERSGQTIVTNSLETASLFAHHSPGNNVYCAGGMLRYLDNSFYGKWTTDCIGSMGMTVAILGTAGVRQRPGLGAVSFDDAEVKRALLRSSEQTFAVLDSSKFHKNVLLEAVRWEELDMVFTDSGISDGDRKLVEDKTRLVVV